MSEETVCLSWTGQYTLYSRADREEETRKPNSVVILYVAGTSEKLRSTFNKHYIPVHFKTTNTVKQKLVHPNDKTPGINRVM